ncbi:MAG: hypothetical protein DMF55_11425 [Acidobacteria bacterium]|nr:MAG: hypothetical protein DMF55_11425 [Acidobacteriota bacterium]
MTRFNATQRSSFSRVWRWLTIFTASDSWRDRCLEDRTRGLSEVTRLDACTVMRSTAVPAKAFRSRFKAFDWRRALSASSAGEPRARPDDGRS